MAETLRKTQKHTNMKKILTILCVTCALAIAAQAQDSAKQKKHEPSPEMKALLDKYDTNKDGKLDKSEKSKMSSEDKAKLREASHTKKHKKKEKEKE